MRVLGHELTPPLAPINSIAGSLSSLLRNPKCAADGEDDMRDGLDIIASRAESLMRFMKADARLARLPPPSRAPCEITFLVNRIVALERRLPVRVLGGSHFTLSCDAAQIEQVLINLVKNAVEAALEQRAEGQANAIVRISWRKSTTANPAQVEILIEDDGPGIAQTTNLFVPFFTTKPEGSGIGLVLCRHSPSRTAPPKKPAASRR